MDKMADFPLKSDQFKISFTNKFHLLYSLLLLLVLGTGTAQQAISEKDNREKNQVQFEATDSKAETFEDVLFLSQKLQRDQQNEKDDKTNIESKTVNFETRLDFNESYSHKMKYLLSECFSLVNYLLNFFVQEFSSSIDKEKNVISSSDEDDKKKKNDEIDISLSIVPDFNNSAQHDKESQEKPNEKLDVINATINNSNDTLNETEAKKNKFKCTPKNITENETAMVRLVNGSTLLTVLRKGQNSSVDGLCVLVLFYAPWCPFCAKIAPHYNAIGRAFSQIDVLAVNAMDFSYLNVQFGTVSVPHIVLFKNSRPILRFNTTLRTFDTLVMYVENTTGLLPNVSVNVSEMDYFAPLSNTPTKQTDYLLILAWIFLAICSIYIVTVSYVGQRMIDQVRILWHEHQHIE